MRQWFNAEKLALNKEKTNTISFIINNSSQYPVNTGYSEKYVDELPNTEFLSLQTNNHLNWKNNTDQLVPKLSEACYAIISMLYISNIKALKSIYLACSRSVMKYRIFLWGISSNSKKILTSRMKT
jgi:hypothetical protein